MSGQFYSPINDAKHNAIRHLRGKYPKAYEIRWSRCELCGSRHQASFLLPDKGLHRFTWCTRCGAHGAA